MRMQVAVVGSAGGELSPEVRAKARAMGRCLGEHDVVVVTGAPPGLPHEAVLGAKEVGALTIPPPSFPRSHRDVYGSPQGLRRSRLHRQWIDGP